MIDRRRLRDLHGVDLPLHVLEQDYIQALYLQELYRETEALVFKGGTYLRHVHGLDRYSEDLDFTQFDDNRIVEELQAAASSLDRYGIPAEIDSVDRGANLVAARLRYDGPLYDGSDRSRGSVELEVSTRDDVARPPMWERLFVPYPDVRAVTARCLVVEEAFAEKVRALSTRTRGRDLYDCWFLLGQGVEIEPDLFEQKMAVVGAEPTVQITVSQHEYDRDLSILVDNPPSYGRIVERVTEALASAGLPVQADID